jgi:hypothetical protein
MSLDVYLNLGEPEEKERIYIRGGGRSREVSREEWDELFPGKEPIIVPTENNEVYWANITHNLATMAGEAGIYAHLWRPGEIDISKAGQLIEPLEEGLAKLRADPAFFQSFNPSNGWGDYDGLVRFVENYLMACEEYPEATIRVSR